MKVIDGNVGTKIPIDVVRLYAARHADCPVAKLLVGTVLEALDEFQTRNGTDTLPRHIIITIADDDADEADREDVQMLDREYVGADAP